MLLLQLGGADLRDGLGRPGGGVVHGGVDRDCLHPLVEATLDRGCCGAGAGVVGLKASYYYYPGAQSGLRYQLRGRSWLKRNGL